MPWCDQRKLKPIFGSFLLEFEWKVRDNFEIIFCQVYTNMFFFSNAPFFYCRIIIHGFLSSRNSKNNKAVQDIYLKSYDVNLIVVNYSRISQDTCYKIVRNRLRLLGKRIAGFLDLLLGDDKWQWENLVIVGHSLGSHVAGSRKIFKIL